MKRIAFAVLCGLATVTGTRVAAACSAGAAALPSAFPGAGATDVPSPSSIFLVSGSDEVPPGLTLLANGAAVPSPGVTSLGRGLAADGWASFFRIAGPLQPSTSYVLQINEPDGTPQTLTQFSTGATYTKDAGTASVVNSLRLWRVHYAPDRVQAGGCVFTEYEGYFALDFTPASIPGTPAAEVVSVLTLSSSQFGTTQSFVFSGITSLPGGLSPEISGDGIALPEGGALSAGAAVWKPTLEPGRTYCATITAYGRNDLSLVSVQSAPVCATVIGLDAAPGSSAATDAGQDPIGNDVGSHGGCTLASGGRPGDAGVVLVFAVALFWPRRRRVRSRL